MAAKQKAWKMLDYCHRVGQLTARPIHDVIWYRPPLPAAVCFQHDHKAPQLECGCGYSAFRTWEEAVRNVNFACRQVIATVELDGVIVEDDRGFRAEKMTIAQFDVFHPVLDCGGDEFVIHNTYEMERRLRRTWGVPVVSHPVGGIGVNPWRHLVEAS